MSSSDEEAVRRPGRATGANGLQSPAPSDQNSSAGNRSPGDNDDQMNEDDDADLFGSDRSEGGFDNDEYGILQAPLSMRKVLTRRPTGLTAPWTMNS